MFTKFVIATFAAVQLMSLRAGADPRLPVCSDEFSNQRARYILGVDFGAGMEAGYADTSVAQVSDVTICSIVGAVSADFDAFLTINKLESLPISLDFAGRLITAQLEINALNGFCSPIPAPADGAPHVATADRVSLKKFAAALATVTEKILLGDVGCTPHFPVGPATY